MGWEFDLPNGRRHIQSAGPWQDPVLCPRSGAQPVGSILNNKEIYASVEKSTIIKTIRLNRLRWFGHVKRMVENRIPKRVLYMNLGSTRLIGRPRNRWQAEVGEDRRIVGGEGWKERLYNREEWKKLLRTARNRHILHMLKE